MSINQLRFYTKRKAAKKNDWYQFNEVAVRDATGKSGNGRWVLDSYEPGVAIVSRKYVDFGTISEGQFRAYLNEFVTKYPAGAEIRARGLAGETLSGSYFLEVPAQIDRIRFDQFFGIAKSLGVTIKERAFKP
jgi:hypothetical protein